MPARPTVLIAGTHAGSCVDCPRGLSDAALADGFEPVDATAALAAAAYAPPPSAEYIRCAACAAARPDAPAVLEPEPPAEDEEAPVAQASAGKAAAGKEEWAGGLASGGCAGRAAGPLLDAESAGRKQRRLASGRSATGRREMESDSNSSEKIGEEDEKVSAGDQDTGALQRRRAAARSIQAAAAADRASRAARRSAIYDDASAEEEEEGRASLSPPISPDVGRRARAAEPALQASGPAAAAGKRRRRLPPVRRPSVVFKTGDAGRPHAPVVPANGVHPPARGAGPGAIAVASAGSRAPRQAKRPGGADGTGRADIKESARAAASAASPAAVDADEPVSRRRLRSAAARESSGSAAAAVAAESAGPAAAVGRRLRSAGRR
jgi:hypothetical protein